MSTQPTEDEIWTRRHTWLWKFEIDRVTGHMVFTVGQNSLDTIEYCKSYAPEGMADDLKNDRFLIEKATAIITEHHGRIELRLGKGQFGHDGEVLDIRHWEPIYVDEDPVRDFGGLDIPFEGLSDDEKDAW